MPLFTLAKCLRVNRFSVVLLAAAVMLSVTMSTAYSATWPEKNVSVVVPFPAGGSTDLIGRMLAEGLSRQFPGSNFMVENISGGANVPAVVAVMKGGHNGNKILMSSETPLFINKYSFKNQQVDPDTALAGVTLLYRTPHSLSVNANSKYKSFDDFVTDIKNNPGKVTVGVNVIGGSAHLSLERWKQANGLQFEIIPYKGGNQAVADLMGGHVDAHVDVLGNAYPFATDGKTKVLAILQNKKIDELPDAKPQDENNPKDLTVASVLVLTVNGKTSPESIEKIYAALKQVTEEKNFVEKMKILHFDLVMAPPAEVKSIREDLSVHFKKMFEASGLPQN